MHQATRKFFANERSVPKQSKPTYQYVMLNQKDVVLPYYGQYSGKKQLQKISSEAQLMRTPKAQQFRNNLNLRRKNDDQQRSNLKFQLQNLKSEVNRLITKDKDPLLLRTPVKQRPPSITTPVHRQQPQHPASKKVVNYVSKQFHSQLFQQPYTDNQQSDTDNFSDTASMTSVTTQKILNQPLRRLQKKVSNHNYDQGYYMQLENDLLRTQIKNLKNKYVSKKRELMEKCELLEKKVEYLEVSWRQSEEVLAETRQALEMEIVTIKRQITMRVDAKSELHRPQSDKPSPTTTSSPQQGNTSNNQLLQQKLKKLYQQLNEKTNRITQLSIQLGDHQSLLQHKKFQLKKQTQKSLELTKQLQLSKRQNSRLQILLQTQISRKKDVMKENQMLKNKNRQLVEEMYKKEQIVVGYEQYESRAGEEIQGYRRREDQLRQRVNGLRQEGKKLKQVVETNNDQIAMLKTSHQQSLTKISQLTKKLNQQLQLNQHQHHHYTQLLQQTRTQQQQKLRIMKQHYQSQFATFNSSQQQEANAITTEQNQMLKEKERQVNRWKAEYKILKLKYEERFKGEEVKRDEGEMYYKSYVEFKTKVALLTDMNKVLQTNLQAYRKKLSDKISQSAKQQLQHQQTLHTLTSQILKLNHQIQNLTDQLTTTKTQLNDLITKNQQEIKYRQELQSKIQAMINKRLFPESEEEEGEGEEEKEVESPQRKRHKMFAQDGDEFEKSPQKQRSPKKSSKKPIQLSQPQQLHLQHLSQAITTMKKRTIQQDQKLAKNIRQLKTKDTQLIKLKKQIRQLLQSHQHQLTDIKLKSIEEKTNKLLKDMAQSEKSLVVLCEQEIESYKGKFEVLVNENVGMKRRLEEYEGEVIGLREEVKGLSHLYNVKCAEVEEFVDRMGREMMGKDQKLDELAYIRQQREANLLNQIALLKDQVSTLRSDIRNLLTINHKLQVKNFDQALRTQIQTSNTLRQQLTKKNQQLYKVRDNYTTLRSQFDNLRSQVQIQKLKNLSQRKNLEIQYQVEMQNLKNKENVDEKRIVSLEQKIALVIQQNRKKDSFIQSYIMGKRLTQNQKELVVTFMKQYEICVNGKSINEKLRADSQELEKMAAYNYRLLKDLAEMKEKMLLYETMEGEALTILDSKHSSGEFNRQADFDIPNSQLEPSPEKQGAKFKKMLSLGD